MIYLPILCPQFEQPGTSPNWGRQRGPAFRIRTIETMRRSRESQDLTRMMRLMRGARRSRRSTSTFKGSPDGIGVPFLGGWGEERWSPPKKRRSRNANVWWRRQQSRHPFRHLEIPLSRAIARWWRKILGNLLSSGHKRGARASAAGGSCSLQSHAPDSAAAWELSHSTSDPKSTA